MNSSVMCKLLKFENLGLLLVATFAFYIAFIRHLNYPYPVHVDEWVHLAYAKAKLAEPFFGLSMEGAFNPNLEAGFHLFLSTLRQIGGLPWLAIFRYFPSVVFTMTVLSVYILARRERFGLEAALLTCLIPTTVGILGPGFLVPLAMGLLFIPITLFLIFNLKNWWGYLLVFILICFLLFIHAATAVGLVIILIPYILLNLKGDFKHSLFTSISIGLPFLSLPWIFNLLFPTAQSLLNKQTLEFYVELPQILNIYGYLPVILGFIGVFILVLRGGKKNYGLVLGLLGLLVMLVTFFTLHYGISIMYYRGLMYMMLMMGIVAGAGLRGIRNFMLPKKLIAQVKLPLITQNIGKVMFLILIAITLVIAIPARQNTDYYHMIDDYDYEAFAWINDNVAKEYEKVILDPWKATAFAAITERHVFTRIHSYPLPRDEQAYSFLGQGCIDTEFLRTNNISIIYTRFAVQNPDLVEVRENIYLLKEAE